MAYTIKWQFNSILNMKKIKLNQYSMSLKHFNPQDIVYQKRMYLADCEDKLLAVIKQKLEAAKYQLSLYAEELKGLSPLYKLESGYSYVTDIDGDNIKSVADIKEGEKLVIIMQDGKAEVEVSKIERNSIYGSKEDDA